MKTAFLLTVVVLLVQNLHAKANEASDTAPADPAKTVQALYDYDLKHAGNSNKQTVKATKGSFTPQLYAAMMAEFNKPVPKGDAPDIDGDVLTDSQDPPTVVKAGKAVIHNNTANVEVSMRWSPGHEKRTVIVTLIRVGNEWKISDINYPSNRTTLTGLLHHGS